MGTGQHRKTYDINVFVDGRGYHHLGSLTEAGIDDLHTGVPKDASNDLDPSVVAIKADFGHKYAQCHG